MDDLEWAKRQLALNQQIEIEAVKIIAAVQGEIEMANEKLAAAKEMLAGARGGIKEFLWQIDYCKEHGKLP